MPAPLARPEHCDHLHSDCDGLDGLDDIDHVDAGADGDVHLEEDVVDGGCVELCGVARPVALHVVDLHAVSIRALRQGGVGLGWQFEMFSKRNVNSLTL